MAFPWLFGLGFGIVFSALFAKIYRVREIIASATEFRRKRVQARDVFYVIALVLLVECIILLVWTVVDPLAWERQVIRASEDGLPLQSVGTCMSDRTSLIFWLIFISFNVCLLFYALILCYKTWSYPSAFAESRWITACVISYIQILLLAVPILVIVNEDNNVFFFVKATIVSLMSMSVTLFIFVPKVVSLNFSSGPATTLGEMTLRLATSIQRARANSNDDLSLHMSGFAPASNIQLGGSSMNPNIVEPSLVSDTVDRVTFAFDDPSEEQKKKEGPSSSQPVVESVVEETPHDMESSEDITSSSTVDIADVEKGL